MNLFISYLWQDPRLFFSWFFIVIFSICFHEFMHAWVALKEGDSTAAERGHLTFNPFKQMGWLSLILFCFIGIAWGMVPVNPRNFRRKHSAALVAFSGPATNLLLGIVFVLLFFICFRFKVGDGFAQLMLLNGGVINFVLFMLNMLPIPGFDGWTILLNFFPRLIRTDSEIVKGSFFVMALLIFIFIDVLFKIGHIIAEYEVILLNSVWP